MWLLTKSDKERGGRVHIGGGGKLNSEINRHEQGREEGEEEEEEDHADRHPQPGSGGGKARGESFISSI